MTPAGASPGELHPITIPQCLLKVSWARRLHAGVTQTVLIWPRIRSASQTPHSSHVWIGGTPGPDAAPLELCCYLQFCRLKTVVSTDQIGLMLGLLFCRFIHLSIHQPINPSMYPTPSIHPSNHSLIHQSTYVPTSIHPSFNIFVHPSIHLSIYSFIHPSVHPSIHLSVLQAGSMSWGSVWSLRTTPWRWGTGRGPAGPP